MPDDEEIKALKEIGVVATKEATIDGKIQQIVGTDVVPMGDADFEEPTFRARVSRVEITKEWPYYDNEVHKEKGVQDVYANVYLLLTKTGQERKYPWRWRVTRSTQGLQHHVIEALKKVIICANDGTPTEKVGINLTDITELIGNEFEFQPETIEFGTYKKENFLLPKKYFRPPPDVGPETPATA